MDSKKRIVISIIGVLVLVVAIIGISFAMYTFVGTGSKTNVIKTGNITLDIGKAEGNSFTFDGTYPMTDDMGISLDENKAEIAVSSSWTGNTPVTIKYDLGIEIVNEGTTLTSDYIKVALVDSTGKVLVGQGSGTNLIGGVTISSLASTKGPNNLITTYGLAGGSISASGTIDKYTIYAWVSEDYNLPVDKTNTTTDNSGDDSTSGFHRKQTETETFKFRVKVIGAQDNIINAVYSVSNSEVFLGTARDAISGYTMNYTTLNNEFFLKHNLTSGNVIESQEVCYLLNDKMNCIKNGTENYEENQEILRASFGSGNCGDVSNSYFTCTYNGITAGLYYNSGDVYVESVSLYLNCRIDNTKNSAYCTLISDSNNPEK